MIDETKAIVEAGTAAGTLVEKLFPGIKARSIDNATSSALHSAMSDIDDILKWARENNMPPEMRDCLINMTFEKRGSDQRIRECLQFAEPNVQDDADVDNLDQEWLDYWRMHAEKARNEDVQAIWGAILAGEVNTPGAISKRTMSILADMSRSEAESFTNLCSCCIQELMPGGLTEPIPLFIDKGEPFEVNPLDIAKLKNLGLVDFSLDSVTRESLSIKCTPNYVFKIESGYYVVVGDGSSTFTFSRFPFTEAGKQLAYYCRLGSKKGFKDALFKHLKDNGFSIGYVDSISADDRFTYRLLN